MVMLKVLGDECGGLSHFLNGQVRYKIGMQGPLYIYAVRPAIRGSPRQGGRRRTRWCQGGVVMGCPQVRSVSRRIPVVICFRPPVGCSLAAGLETTTTPSVDWLNRYCDSDGAPSPAGQWHAPAGRCVLMDLYELWWVHDKKTSVTALRSWEDYIAARRHPLLQGFL